MKRLSKILRALFPKMPIGATPPWAMEIEPRKRYLFLYRQGSVSKAEMGVLIDRLSGDGVNCYAIGVEDPARDLARLDIPWQ